MSAMASQITGVLFVCSTVCSGADQRKHRSSASLTFVRGIHWWRVSNAENVSIWRRHHWGFNLWPKNCDIGNKNLYKIQRMMWLLLFIMVRNVFFFHWDDSPNLPNFSLVTDSVLSHLYSMFYFGFVIYYLCITTCCFIFAIMQRYITPVR